MVYLISYDLVLPGQNYQALYDVLEGWGAKRALQSTWVVRLNNTSSAAIRDELMKHIDTNDRLLVDTLGQWASFSLMVDLNQI
ncbi:MAG: SinR family protein [Chloroflexi bacterium]|nr:SinR family protein [Chloroflexota bacterium]